MGICERCGKFSLGKVCKHCGHVNSKTVIKSKVKDQEKAVSEIEKRMGKVKKPKGSGESEASPAKFFGIFVGLAVLCFVFFKPNVQSASNWVDSNLNIVPDFFGNEFIGLSILDWIIIFVVAGTGAGILSTMTLTAIGISVGVVVAFVLLIWPIIQPTVSDMLDSLGEIVGFGISSGSGDQVNEIYNYELEAVSSDKLKLTINKKTDKSPTLEIEKAYLSNGDSLSFEDSTIEVSDDEEVVYFEYGGGLGGKTVFIELSYGYSSSKAANFYFTRGDKPSSSEPEIDAPVDIDFTVIPEDYAVGGNEGTVDVEYVIELNNKRHAWDEKYKVSGKAVLKQMEFGIEGDDTYFNGGSCIFQGMGFTAGDQISGLNKELDDTAKVECDVEYTIPSTDEDWEKKTIRTSFKTDYEYKILVTEKIGSKAPGMAKTVDGDFRLAWPINEEDTISMKSCHGDTMPYGIHKGIDISCVVGTNVYAPEDGVVAAVGYSETGGSYLKIKFDDVDLWSVFYHLDSVTVNEGDHVSKNQLVAKSGNTGDSTGPHLHFHLQDELYDDSNPYDPCDFFEDKKFCDQYCS